MRVRVSCVCACVCVRASSASRLQARGGEGTPPPPPPPKKNGPHLATSSPRSAPVCISATARPHCTPRGRSASWWRGPRASRRRRTGRRLPTRRARCAAAPQVRAATPSPRCRPSPGTAGCTPGTRCRRSTAQSSPVGWWWWWWFNEATPWGMIFFFLKQWVVGVMLRHMCTHPQPRAKKTIAPARRRLTRLAHTRHQHRGLVSRSWWRGVVVGGGGRPGVGPPTCGPGPGPVGERLRCVCVCVCVPWWRGGGGWACQARALWERGKRAHARA